MNTTVVKQKLKEQKIGIPTLGYCDSGTRFHFMHLTASLRNIEESLQDAAVVHRLTRVCPTVDLHTASDVSGDWETSGDTLLTSGSRSGQ